MLPKEELIAIVDGALDDARFRLRVTNDSELAERLGISTKTISFLRNGHWTQVDTALIGVLVSTLRPSAEHPISG